MRAPALRRRIVEYVRSQGGWIVATTGVAQAGTPDLIACVHGRFLAIEIKTGRDAMSKRQELERERITKAGGTYIVAKDVSDVAGYV